MLAGLWRLHELPDWLRPERLKSAMERSIPEFASGALALKEVRPKRIHLKNGFHGGTFKLAVDGPGESRRVVNLLGHLSPTASATAPPPRSTVRFAEAGWRGALPELGLVLETPPSDRALPAQAVLTDADRARALLEYAMRTGSPRLRDIHIERCTPQVARYNPGSRCTVVYRLEFGAEAGGRDWPPVVVAKTHRGDKGRIAYQSMTALWGSDLRSGAVVTLAEPLAYLPELKVLVQAGVRGDSTLADLVERVLLHDGATPDENARLRDYLAKVARGLVALHGCGVRGEPYDWDQEMAEVRERIGRLADWIPGFSSALAPALARIEELADAYPAQRPVASHRSFRPAQVLLHEGRIAFIDFDGFCETEPATDLALFCASMKQNVLRTAEREDQAELPLDRLQRMMEQLDELCELFLSEYERSAPASRERVELWETLYLVENLLNTWEKVRPEHLRSSMALLEHHLRQSRLPLL